MKSITYKFAIVFIALILGACQNFMPTKLDYGSLKVNKPLNELDYAVYTPPNWQRDESLPVLLFLHGARDQHTSFEKFKANEYLDRQINEGKLPRLIIVTPNGKNGFWENWYDGSHNYRDWIVDELLPKVKIDYNTLACPEHCHIAGISMGGFGALRMASLKQGIFSSVSAISAPIFNEEDSKKARQSLLTRLFFPLNKIFGPESSEASSEQNIETLWIKDKNLHKTRLQLVAGSDDREQIINSNNRFHRLLAIHNIPHDYFIYEGGHKWKYWVPNLDKIILFSLDSTPKNK